MWFELNVLNNTKLLKISDMCNFVTHIYQLKLIPPTGRSNEKNTISFGNSHFHAQYG